MGYTKNTRSRGVQMIAYCDSLYCGLVGLLRTEGPLLAIIACYRSEIVK